MPTPYPRQLTPSSDAPEERLLDDAIDDTFPASDPVSHGQPGSIVNRRYSALTGDAPLTRRESTTSWLLLAGVIAFGLALMLGRRRHRDSAH
jgi:LPXTG-motif cell wall-anchored protein